jgi:anti-sigma factor RsiW
MNCEEVREYSPLWHTGELDEQRRLAFDMHLSACAACAVTVAEESALDLRVRRAFHGEIVCRDTASENINVSDRVNRAVLREIDWRRKRRRIVWASAAAALLLSVFTIGYGVRRSPGPARIYVDAARDHRAEVIEHGTRKWRTAPDEIGALAVKFSLSAGKPQALAPEGFHLVHAKICGLDGRPVLHLVYSNDQREVSLYVAQTDGSSVVPADIAEIGQERLAWARGRANPGRSAVVVSTGTADECRQIARRAAALL